MFAISVRCLSGKRRCVSVGLGTQIREICEQCVETVPAFHMVKLIHGCSEIAGGTVEEAGISEEMELQAVIVTDLDAVATSIHNYFLASGSQTQLYDPFDAQVYFRMNR